MAYTPQHIANYFIDQAEEDGSELSPLKLIKLVYIAYGWYLALVGEKLYDEPIEAWKHGPVVPSIYHEFKHYRNKPIDARASTLDLDTGDFMYPDVEPEDERALLVLRHVWRAYGRFTGWALRTKTHQAGTPWFETYRDDERGRVIPDELVAAHFQKKIREYLDAGRRVTASATA